MKEEAGRQMIAILYQNDDFRQRLPQGPERTELGAKGVDGPLLKKATSPPEPDDR